MARDIFHPIVREALEKEGWTITHDPYFIETMGRDYQIDLAAELLVAAERDTEKIAVEVKSFLSASPSYEFHTVLGQYLNYLTFLEIQEPERELYLAVDDEIFETFFTEEATQYVLEKYEVNVIVVNERTKRIEQWTRNKKNTAP
jgi:hypothetical protein